MNLLLIPAILLTGMAAANGHAFEVDLTRSGVSVHREESGVMSHGTISEIRNDQIVVLTWGSQEPIRYSHGEGTIYVNESGDPISLDIVKSGVAVTVFYSQAEGQRMANRVIVGEIPLSPEFSIDC